MLSLCNNHVVGLAFYCVHGAMFTASWLSAATSTTPPINTYGSTGVVRNLSVNVHMQLQRGQRLVSYIIFRRTLHCFTVLHTVLGTLTIHV